MIDVDHYEKVHKTKAFKKAFWDWFDAQPQEFKRRYWYNANDMACLFFYNRVYLPQNQLRQ